jgi:hypothetical protein
VAYPPATVVLSSISRVGDILTSEDQKKLMIVARSGDAQYYIDNGRWMDEAGNSTLPVYYRITIDGIPILVILKQY